MTSEYKSIKAIGMMTGTSFDGIDCSIIETNGLEIHKIGPNKSFDYTDCFRDKIRSLMREKVETKLLLEVSNELTKFHAETVNELLISNELSANEIDVIGFHGQTIYHDPKNYYSLQIGNAALLSQLTEIDVVSDFRSKDIANKGQGAPLVPIFHKSLFNSLKKPLAILNIGGVSNITYIDSNGRIIAFDTGPGGALLDDLIYHKTGKSFDYKGIIASQGNVDKKLLEDFMKADYFRIMPPKSLDRNQFSEFIEKLNEINYIDAAATLTYFIAHSVHESLKFLPEAPSKWIVCGGGRYNTFLMKIMQEKYDLNLANVDDIKINLNEKTYSINGDFIESQAFAFLAVRSLYGLPITFPSTTGVAKELSGGSLYRF